VATQPDPVFLALNAKTILDLTSSELGYLPSLSEILSHFELIPDAALTLYFSILCPNSYEKEIKPQQKNSDSIEL